MGIRGPIRYFVQKLRRIEQTKKSHRISIDKPTLVDRIPVIFPVFSKPFASIVIVFHNNKTFIRNCLSSITKNLPKQSFEVIVIDDNSSETFDFSDIKNIHLIHNKTTLGFSKSVNLGIENARGEYIYLLDSNAMVLEGFLDELVEVFGKSNNVGAVGSLLLNSDGSLQEAGSLFLKDFQSSQIVDIHPYYPQVNYVYQVDFCSFDSIIFKRVSPNGELNFIDETPPSSFFKEAPFCLRLKHGQGKDIFISPFSRVISFNERNNIIPADSTLSNYTHHRSLNERWNRHLSVIQAKERRERFSELYNNKTIVFFHDRIPEYDRYSGDLRLTEIITAFKNLGYHITLITPKNRIDNPYNAFFQKLGVCVFYEYKLFNELNNFSNGIPAGASICWLSTASMFIKYYNVAKKYWPEAKLVFDMVDIHHLRFKRALEHDPNSKFFKNEYARNLVLEKRASQKADITIPISQQEAEYMDQFCSPKKMIVISNIHYPKVKLSEITNFEKRDGLFFIGSLHHPNIDAVQFLINEIMPAVWETLPNIKLHIVGNLNKVMKEIKHPNIKFYGHVPDVSVHFLKHKIMVAPLRSGAGVKGKIGQAFEYYLPVVTSTIGAEGMSLVDGENALLAETAQQFADKIIRLYTDKQLWISLGSNSKNSLRPFSKETLLKRIQEIEKND
ncbi:glycosyltransferase [Sphingobacterium alkalisoli]|uniref:Glycosyltransferase n=1 Tax=Sphingobacterium alkalisoli TaxID=1874115 RepID=A0A4U0GYD4_9SPHI|nr:glycosyltransferase [Sphingobacterium alkalisoli]TJY64221.1 glycosyltransferase [Sphingobacterium alkalisoli]GGH23093.1 glycosyl transferase family protein [Sphingobacterium alkalisoli]